MKTLSANKKNDSIYGVEKAFYCFKQFYEVLSFACASLHHVSERHSHLSARSNLHYGKHTAAESQSFSCGFWLQAQLLVMSTRVNLCAFQNWNRNTFLPPVPHAEIVCMWSGKVFFPSRHFQTIHHLFWLLRFSPWLTFAIVSLRGLRFTHARTHAYIVFFRICLRDTRFFPITFSCSEAEKKTCARNGICNFYRVKTWKNICQNWVYILILNNFTKMLWSVRFFFGSRYVRCCATMCITQILFWLKISLQSWKNSTISLFKLCVRTEHKVTYAES